MPFIKLATAAKQRIREAIAAGVVPERMKTNEGLVLRHGARGRIKLVGDDGAQTNAGKFWLDAGGEPLAEAGFMQQKPFRVGNREFIKLRNGQRAMVRQWDAAGGEFRFTRLGNRFYEIIRRNFVAHVPITIRMTRKNGTIYSRSSTMPIEKLGIRPVELPLNLSEAERHKRVKEMISSQLPPGGVLNDGSDETWEYDAEGTWTVDEEVVGTDPDTQEAEAHVIMDRRVGALTLDCSAQLPRAESICTLAFDDRDDHRCGPRQMAALLNTDMTYIIGDLELIGRDLYGEDFELDELGCTPAMIMEYCRARDIGCICIHNERVIEQTIGSPSIAFAVHEDHVYFYERAYEGLKTLNLLGEDDVKLKVLRRVKEVVAPIAEWEHWSGTTAPGNYWVFEEELEHTRKWFLERNRSPRISLKSMTSLSGLRYHCREKADGAKGLCVIRGLPAGWPQYTEWLERLGLGIEYTGSNLPSLALNVLQMLIKRNRRRLYPTGNEQEALLEACEGRCETCGSEEKLEWDHVSRLSEGFGEQKFQALCHECHRQKTEQECRLYDDDVLASFFEEEVWNNYVLSPRLPPLVFKNKPDEGKLDDAYLSQSALHADELPDFEIVDVIRCRKRALEFNVHDLPVFSPLDDIKVRGEHRLGDLNFVTRPYKHAVDQLGYTGPGWQHRVQTEFLLHMSVISWEDISHTLTASASYPANLLVEPLRVMEEAWGADRDNAKFAVNSLIGLWCIDEASDLTVRSSRREDDAPQCCLKRRILYPGGCTYDFIVKKILATNASCRPLHDLCLCTEAVRVGQMIYALKRAKAVPYQFKTDSILYKLPAGKKAKPHLDQIRFRDLHLLRKQREPLAACVAPSCEVAPVLSDECPFRVNRATRSDRLRSNPSLPTRKPWDLALRPRVWELLSEDEAVNRVLERESLMVSGIAGTGKTTWCQKLVARLEDMGLTVQTISKTHLASRRAGGETGDHWVRRNVLYGRPACDVLWLDEVSQFDAGLLTQLAKLTLLSGISFLVSGDFNQFGAIANSFRGTILPAELTLRSNLLHTMGGGNILFLTECRRSDRELFNFYSSIIEGGSRFEDPLGLVLAEAGRSFPARIETYRHNLVISHRRRRALNRMISLILAPAGAMAITMEDDEVKIWPGLELVGCTSSRRKGLFNGCPYTITAIEGDKVSFEELEGPMTFEQVATNMRLSFASTYAGCQGTEFGGTLSLRDVRHRFFTRTHLFVGLSRGKASHDVSIGW